MASAPVDGRRFEMGRVFSRMFSGLASNWIVLAGFALATSIATVLSNSASMSQIVQGFNSANPAAALAMFSGPYYWLGMVGTIVIGSFASSGLISALLIADTGSKPEFSDCLRGGVAFFLPMIALTVLWWIGVGFGWVLFVIPGLILLTMWSVSAPALVAERLGVLAAFGRSRALTKGSRWPIFGTLVVFLILYSIAAMAVQGFSTTGMIALYRTSFVAGIVVGTLTSGLLGVLLNAFLVALYRETVIAKEGNTDLELAAVFA